jgi:predicted nucleic acid-binding protein
MKRIGVDTNVVLSLVTDRDAAQQERAAELFGSAVAGQQVAVLHHTVISECVFVMSGVYGTPATRVAAVLRDLLDQPGIVSLDGLDLSRVWALWPRRIKDFGDACLTAVAEAGGFDELATFDAAFAKRARRQGVSTYW